MPGLSLRPELPNEKCLNDEERKMKKASPGSEGQPCALQPPSSRRPLSLLSQLTSEQASKCDLYIFANLALSDERLSPACWPDASPWKPHAWSTAVPGRPAPLGKPVTWAGPASSGKIKASVWFTSDIKNHRNELQNTSMCDEALRALRKDSSLRVTSPRNPHPGTNPGACRRHAPLYVCVRGQWRGPQEGPCSHSSCPSLASALASAGSGSEPGRGRSSVSEIEQVDTSGSLPVTVSGVPGSGGSSEGPLPKAVLTGLALEAS